MFEKLNELIDENTAKLWPKKWSKSEITWLKTNILSYYPIQRLGVPDNMDVTDSLGVRWEWDYNDIHIALEINLPTRAYYLSSYNLYDITDERSISTQKPIRSIEDWIDLMDLLVRLKFGFTRYQ